MDKKPTSFGSIECFSGVVASRDFEQTRTNFYKNFKKIDVIEREKICKIAAESVCDNVSVGKPVDAVLVLMASAISVEKDWNATQHFLQHLVHRATSAEVFREVALSLLELTDHHLEDSNQKQPLAQTALVLLTELGILLATHQPNSILPQREVSAVVEYITSNLISRSNVSDTSLRISLIHYLSKCQTKTSSSQQLNRVISRFGQSLMDEMMRLFFSDKRKGNAAFYFLVEHLNHFFNASPALADMSNSVLKNYMLRFPSEFPLFLASYSDHMSRDEKSLMHANIHISLLYRCALEINQKQLCDSLALILTKNFSYFMDVSTQVLKNQYDISVKIITGKNPKKYSDNSSFQNFEKELKAMIELAVGQDSGKVVSLRKTNRHRDMVLKHAKIGQKPTPLETILQLAS